MTRLRLFVLVAVLTTGASTGAHAQWLNYPTPGTPRTPDGKPDLAAPAPKGSDGKPDLSGIWEPERNRSCPPGGCDDRLPSIEEIYQYWVGAQGRAALPAVGSGPGEVAE